MSAPTIRGGWASYRERVMDANAGPVQVSETEGAFFAGAYFAIYCLIAGADEKALRAEITERVPGLSAGIAKGAAS